MILRPTVPPPGGRGRDVPARSLGIYGRVAPPIPFRPRRGWDSG